MTHRNVQTTAVIGGLLLLAGFLLWLSLEWVWTAPSDAEVRAPPPREVPEAVTDPVLSTIQRELIADEPGTEGAQVETPQTGALRIQVVDGNDNSPVPGVGVSVREIPRHGPNGVQRRFEADAKGVVRVAGLRPGRVSIATNRRRMGYKVAEVIADQETALTIVMKNGIDLTGVVVDTGELAVAGASVILGDGSGKTNVVATSDEDGRFAIRPVPRRVNVAARAKGYAPSPYRTITAGSGAKVHIRIVMPGEGGSVEGRVLDPDGNGVADATVKIGAKPLRGPQPRERTDGDGGFHAMGLKPGSSPVTVQTESYAPWSGRVDVVAHTTMPMVIRLSRGVACEGTVRDEKGAPLAGIEVQHGDWKSIEARSTRTALDGGFRFAGLPAAKPLTFRVRSEKFGDAIEQMQGEDGETLRLDMTLSPGLVLEGRVLGKDGKPLPMAYVSAEEPMVRGRNRWFRHTQTDDNGKFVLIGCPEGPVIELDVRTTGYLELFRRNIDAAAGPIELRMHFEGHPTARITGKLIDPDGQPVKNARIQVGRNGDGGRSYTTNAAGEIDIEKLRPGLCTVRIRAGGHANYVSEERPLESDETWNLGTVQLVRGGRLEVDFRRPAGTEKERVFVSIFRRGLWLSGGFTREPVMLSEPLVPDVYDLEVWGPKVVPETIPFTIRSGEKTHVKVTPKFGATRKFEMILPDGTDAIRLVHYQVTGVDGSSLRGRRARLRSDPFILEMGFHPSRYTFRAHTEAGHKAQIVFEVTVDGKAETIRLDLK